LHEEPSSNPRISALWPPNAPLSRWPSI